MGLEIGIKICSAEQPNNAMNDSDPCSGLQRLLLLADPPAPREGHSFELLLAPVDPCVAHSVLYKTIWVLKAEAVSNLV